MYAGASWALSPERASANMKMGKNQGQNTRGHRYITVPDKLCNRWWSYRSRVGVAVLPYALDGSVSSFGSILRYPVGWTLEDSSSSGSHNGERAALLVGREDEV
jgi:hypothetical protein